MPLNLRSKSNKQEENIMKKVLTLVLAAVMLLSLLVLSGCGGGTTVDANTLQLTYWIAGGADAVYYPIYEDNPCIKYVETLEFNGKKIDFQFQVPVTGAELDNFNTLLATEEYAGIMDMSRSTTSATELYADGIIHDLTPYVEQYMPNYMALLEEFSHLKSYVTSQVDGETKYLQLYGIREKAQANFMGFCYRRDWVAKYGKHPTTGAAFTYGFEVENDGDTWHDDVVFPSGGSDPVYISDWEWMFEIFELAMADLGITDGYCTSIYFKGYLEDGGLYSGFGGGAPLWFRGADGNAAFGGDSDNMRTYLTCLNNWYEKGWLDKQFAEHTSDIAYAVDSEKVHTGKVGLWLGRTGELGAEMDMDDAYTDGIMVCGAKQPINDVYGTDAQKNKNPDSMYQMSQLSSALVISDKVSVEDLPTVLTMLDYFYTEEGGALLAFGLNKEQVELIGDEVYPKFGLNNGAYERVVAADGSISYVADPKTYEDTQLGNAICLNRIATGVFTEEMVISKDSNYNQVAIDAHNHWDFYTNTGYPDKAIMAQFTTEESNAYNKVHANVDTYMSTNIPKFINGSLDINSEEDWGDYCTMLNKYGPEKITKVFQRLYAGN